MKKKTLKNAPTTETEVPSRDVVIVHGVTEDRKGLRVLRARNEALEAGELRPVIEGQPISSDLVRLKPRPKTPFVCDVETTYVPRGQSATGDVEPSSAQLAKRQRSGPAQVASKSYRENWDAIWSKAISAPGSSQLN